MFVLSIATFTFTFTFTLSSPKNACVGDNIGRRQLAGRASAPPPLQLPSGEHYSPIMSQSTKAVCCFGVIIEIFDLNRKLKKQVHDFLNTCFLILLRDDCCLSFLCSLEQLSCEKTRYVTTQTTACSRRLED